MQQKAQHSMKWREWLLFNDWTVECVKNILLWGFSHSNLYILLPFIKYLLLSTLKAKCRLFFFSSFCCYFCFNFISLLFISTTHNNNILSFTSLSPSQRSTEEEKKLFILRLISSFSLRFYFLLNFSIAEQQQHQHQQRVSTNNWPLKHNIPSNVCLLQQHSRCIYIHIIYFTFNKKRKHCRPTNDCMLCFLLISISVSEEGKYNKRFIHLNKQWKMAILWKN